MATLSPSAGLLAHATGTENVPRRQPLATAQSCAGRPGVACVGACVQHFLSTSGVTDKLALERPVRSTPYEVIACGASGVSQRDERLQSGWLLLRILSPGYALNLCL